jgi:pimeloyl-ACP methyl ester carboxylesterase
MAFGNPQKRNNQPPKMVLEGGKPYTLESGINVEITSAEFKPRDREGRDLAEAPPDRGVIVMGGWGNTRLVTMKDLSQAFADNAKASSYLVSARSLEQGNKMTGETPHFLYEEAHAVSQFIKERGLKEVTIAAHSQGASRAIDVANILQNDPTIKVEGLVLLGPTGLYEQDPLDLAKTFLAHTGLEIPKAVKKAAEKGAPYIHGLAKRGNEHASPDEQTAREILKEGTWDGLMTNFDLLRRHWLKPATLVRKIKSEIGEMAKKNPRAEHVRVPIVLITGTHDPVSSRERIVPSEEEEKMRKEMDESPGQRKTLAAREKILRNELFRNSPYVRMIVPEKMGNHLVQIFRPESVAKVSLYLLKRQRREKAG